MTIELTAFVIANADTLVGIVVALPILGLIGLSLFATDGGKEISKREEEEDSLDAEHGRLLLPHAKFDRVTGGHL